MTDTPAMTDVDAPPTSELPGLATFGALAVALAVWGFVGSMFVSPMALFLPVALSIGIWVAWNDMAFMKIPNAAVLSLVLAYAVLGLFAFPLEDYLWRWANLAVLLVITMVMNALRMMGAGDSKFIAAMGPIFAVEDMGGIMRLFAATVIAAFIIHRIARRMPFLESRVGHWESWTRRDFPMGLALGAGLIFYVGLLVYLGR